jgi:hypothetical protein
MSVQNENLERDEEGMLRRVKNSERHSIQGSQFDENPEADFRTSFSRNFQCCTQCELGIHLKRVTSLTFRFLSLFCQSYQPSL